MAEAIPADGFVRSALPPHLCNIERLLHALGARGRDGGGASSGTVTLLPL